MDERYQLPARNTLANSLLPKMHIKVQRKLDEVMDDVTNKWVGNFMLSFKCF